MTRPLLLDLFCGAGGAAVGYHRAGFDVVGVDSALQPNYPFELICDDALAVVAEVIERRFVGVAVIHASPPCQAYSSGGRMRQAAPGRNHPRLIEPVRQLLLRTGLPYVIENVPEAPLRNPVRLCGSSLGITAIEGVRRHRAFESNIPLMVPPCSHGLQSQVVGVYGDHPQNSLIRKGSPAIRARDVQHAQQVMGIDWMTEWSELKEAIPPAYTELLGAQLLEHLERAA